MVKIKNKSARLIIVFNATEIHSTIPGIKLSDQHILSKELHYITRRFIDLEQNILDRLYLFNRVITISANFVLILQLFASAILWFVKIINVHGTKFCWYLIILCAIVKEKQV